MKELKDFRKIFFLISVIFFVGCNKKEYIRYDQNISKEKIECLGLDPLNSKALNKDILPLFNFKKDCKYKISLSGKSDIVCNSSFNSSRKATSAFPSSYLRLELKRGMDTLFSYYVDLTSPPSSSDVKRAFEVMQKYIKLKQ
jgi:hypothetical protein